MTEELSVDQRAMLQMQNARFPFKATRARATPQVSPYSIETIIFPQEKESTRDTVLQRI
jgi:hypothetical protein